MFMPFYQKGEELDSFNSQNPLYKIALPSRDSLALVYELFGKSIVEFRTHDLPRSQHIS